MKAPLVYAWSCIALAVVCLATRRFSSAISLGALGVLSFEIVRVRRELAEAELREQIWRDGFAAMERAALGIRFEP